MTRRIRSARGVGSVFDMDAGADAVELSDRCAAHTQSLRPMIARMESGFLAARHLAAWTRRNSKSRAALSISRMRRQACSA